MSVELGEAYVKIMPSARGIKGTITRELGGEAGAAGTSAGGLFGNSFTSAAMRLIGAIGIGKVLGDTIAEAGNLQQSLGGLETIYGDAAGAAREYAAQAASAGISTNDFAEQAVSFGAALRQAYGGDTSQAIDAANIAILDMADNAAKMGTSIDSIQQAYQGFARGQYQLLDNLKLGYGGTKTEMERLLADAEAISGVHYDIGNLGDVYAAIHVIQEELGIAGVAAQEAETTLTGSFGAMKAAAANLMGNLALGEDISDELNTMMQSVGTWARNLLPLVSNALSGLPQVISGALQMAVSGLGNLAANAGGIVQWGLDLITQLGLAIVQALPQLASAAIEVVAAIGNALMTADWIGAATSVIEGLRTSIASTAGITLGADTSIIQAMGQSITAGLPELLSKGVEIITNIVTGILTALPTVITTGYQLMTDFVTTILQNLPTILSAGVQLILSLIQGIIQNLPQVVSSAMTAIAQFIATIVSQLPTILQQGIKLLGQLALGIIQAIPDLIGKLPQVFQSIVNAFGSFNWLDIGVNVIKGIIDGILSMGEALITGILNMCSGALDAVKNFFGIKSPAKRMADEVGRWIPPGVAVGILDNMEPLNEAMAEMGEIAIGSYSMDTVGGGQLRSQRDTQLDAVVALLARYLPECAEKTVIDGDSLTNSINRQLGVAYL